ncbi:MAG: helix-turn-helix domain-containing protein [Treponema sp.]|jgi:transcriptional regulator with XRE-family HTH domain|nr:helix-turn-helix domain-containing protein [Treponema sp.]
MSFSKHLKGELEYRGMLVKELAHATGISKSTLDNYLLTNGTMPSAENAVAIAQVLGVTVEYLVTGKEIPYTEVPGQSASPEMRSIAAYVAPLTREKREVIERTVAELVRFLEKPLTDEPVALTPLQKVFLRLFR